MEDLENLKMVAPPAAPAHLAHLPGIAFNDYAGNLAANNLARLDPARQLAEQQRVNLLHQRANQQAMAEHAVRLQALQAARLADAARDERAFRKRVAADAKAEEARASKRARLLQ